MLPEEAIHAMRDKYRRDRPPPLPTTKEKYADYLSTLGWKRKHNLVLNRARAKCEGCGMAQATEVHHLTYAHVGAEFLFELVALCGACHDRWHQSTNLNQKGK